VATIKAVALDVDGVLTDGSFSWSESGEETKSFHFADVMGISLARKAGFIFCLISGEESPLVDRLAAKLKIDDVYKGWKDKGEALKAFAKTHGFDLEEVCYMGDDVNDLPALELAGLSAAPANAQDVVRLKVKLITQHSGGRGAVRELLEGLIAKKGKS
jgi:3-deoxy-D-manno-octulosonate 8-phosphate phosphatase (KDO 8-P phosphatase)